MIVKLIKNPEVVMITALLLGLFFPDASSVLKPYILPALVMLMTLSLMGVHVPKKEHIEIKEVKRTLLLNFLLLSGLLILASLFVKNEAHRIGLMMIACMPPAVGIIAQSEIIGGDTAFAMIYEVVGYVVSLIYTPLLVFLIFGKTVPPLELIKTMVLLIIIPFILSRVLRYFKVKFDTKPWMNVVYGYGIYIAVAVGFSSLTESWLTVIPAALVLIVVKLGLTAGVALFCKAKKVPRKKAIVYTLFSSLKNGNMALGLVILFFANVPEALIPFAINVMIVPFQLILTIRLWK